MFDRRARARSVRCSTASAGPDSAVFERFSFCFFDLLILPPFLFPKFNIIAQEAIAAPNTNPMAPTMVMAIIWIISSSYPTSPLLDDTQLSPHDLQVILFGGEACGDVLLPKPPMPLIFLIFLLVCGGMCLSGGGLGGVVGGWAWRLAN